MNIRQNIAEKTPAPCRYCGERPGRDVYHGVCWICELGVLAGDLPKPDQWQANRSEVAP